MYRFKKDDLVEVSEPIPFRDYSEIKKRTKGKVLWVNAQRITVVLDLKARLPGFLGFFRKRLVSQYPVSFTHGELEMTPYLRIAPR